MAKQPPKVVIADTALTLRHILALVEEGTLEAKSGQAVALLRRLEGATAALEIAAGVRRESAER